MHDLRVSQQALANNGIPIALADLKTAYTFIDEEQIHKDQVARFTYKKWEGEPLGQLRSEAEVRRHYKMTSDDVAYFLYLDGRQMYFQYCNPSGHEPMTEANWETIAQDQVQKKARMLTEQEVTLELQSKVLKTKK